MLNRNKYILFLCTLVLLLCACSKGQRSGSQRQTLHIIHAGSLSLPVKHIAEAFMKKNPDVRILTEAWGSKAGARRLMELSTPADVYLSADYMVIEHMLIPDHASWYISFAANEMAIVYTKNSRYAELVDSTNWYHILLRPDVRIGRSDPDMDPCGVRTVFTSKLAGIYYGQPDLAERILEKDRRFIRPKETDLIALLETGHLDYIFLYRSVARQHGLPYLELPPALSLGDASLEDWYAQVSVTTLGAAPGTEIVEIGQSMVYGLCIPHKTKNQELAEEFLAFFLDAQKGMAIMEEMGQRSLVPTYSPYFEQIPESLRKFSLPKP